jgi:hypothetical protein
VKKSVPDRRADPSAGVGVISQGCTLKHFELRHVFRDDGLPRVALGRIVLAYADALPKGGDVEAGETGFLVNLADVLRHRTPALPKLLGKREPRPA